MPTCGSATEAAPRTEPYEPYARSAVSAASPAGKCRTCTTPTKEVAPYSTGADPFKTSTRSVPVKSKVVMAGLNAPPQGTPSTTRRKASNSCNPQNEGTALDGPASPPATKLSTPDISFAPRAAISAPETTDRSAGIRSTGSGTRVAVTTMASSASAIETKGMAKSTPMAQLAIVIMLKEYSPFFRPQRTVAWAPRMAWIECWVGMLLTGWMG